MSSLRALALARGLLLPEAVGEAYPELLLIGKTAVLREGGRGRFVFERALYREGILGIERYIGPVLE